MVGENILGLMTPTGFALAGALIPRMDCIIGVIPGGVGRTGVGGGAGATGGVGGSGVAVIGGRAAFGGDVAPRPASAIGALTLGCTLKLGLSSTPNPPEFGYVLKPPLPKHITASLARIPAPCARTEP